MATFLNPISGLAMSVVKQVLFSRHVVFVREKIHIRKFTVCLKNCGPLHISWVAVLDTHACTRARARTRARAHILHINMVNSYAFDFLLLIYHK